MKKSTTRRWVAAAVAMATVVLAVTGAYAYFSSAGTGTASTSVATPAPLTLSPGTPVGQIYPGGSADVAVEIDNPNPFRVRVGSLLLDAAHSGGFSVDAAHDTAGCTAAAAGLSFSSQSVDQFVSPKVGAVDGHLTLDLTDALSMSAGAADACQGATFSVFLQVGA